jgi:hypothetical protein
VVRSQPGQIVPRPYLEKNPSQERVGGVAQGVGPGFKDQYCKNNKKKVELRVGSGGKSLHPSSGLFLGIRQRVLRPEGALSLWNSRLGFVHNKILFCGAVAGPTRNRQGTDALVDHA